MTSPQVHIPQPCPESWDAMTPTTAGRHCAACQTEVIDFTRMTEAEMLAYLAARPGQHLCVARLAPARPHRAKGAAVPRRWLLAAALLGWQSVAAVPPQLPPPGQLVLFKPVAGPGRIVVRGVVLDDSLHVPVEGAFIFISGTKYGATTDEQGRFVLSLPADWKFSKKGELLLDVKPVPFALQGQQVVVKIPNAAPPAPLTIRLLSHPQRGRIMGKPMRPTLPVPLPGTPKNQQ